MKTKLVISSFLISINMLAQTQNLETDFDYKNFNSYYEKTIEAAETGDAKKMANFAKYAQKHYDKLEKKSFDLSSLHAKKVKLDELFQEGNKANDEAKKSKEVINYFIQWSMPLKGLRESKVLNGTGVHEMYFKEFDLGVFKENLNWLNAHQSYLDKEENNNQLLVKNAIQDYTELVTISTQDKLIITINQVIEKCLNETDVNNFDSYLNSLNGIVNTLLKVAPDQTNYSFLKERITSLESNKEKLLKDNENQRQNEIAESRKIKELPERQHHDKVLEKDFFDLLAKKDPNSQLVEVIINSRDWAEEKNLGQLIRRRRLAVAVKKDNDGNCYLDYYTFAQNYNNGKFLESYIESSDGKYQIDCGLVND